LPFAKFFNDETDAIFKKEIALMSGGVLAAVRKVNLDDSKRPFQVTSSTHENF
jgi:hypothetical protein